MRRKAVASLLLFLMLGLTGCETLPKKFIRKKKEKKHTPSVVYLDQGPYEKQFSNEYYYKTHFTLWKTWHSETLDSLGGNAKKLRRSAEEAYSHLDQMSRYLKPEKQAELKPLLEESKRFMDRFDSGSDSRTAAMAMKSDLDTLRRRISNDFYYDKVKDEILPDAVAL